MLSIVGIAAIFVIVTVIIVKYFLPKKEVFFIGLDKPGMETYAPLETFKDVMNKLKVRLATKEEMESIVTKGAQWCAVGFYQSKNPEDVCFPMQQKISECGAVDVPKVVYTTSKEKLGGVNVYGVKPQISESKMTVNGTVFTIRPLTELIDLNAEKPRPITFSKWSVYDK